MNKDLKWLAENVHEWRHMCEYAGVYRHHHDSEPRLYWSCGVEDDCHKTTHHTRIQWQAARAELSGKPSWDDAPEWANWLAQDKDGEWWFYEEKPIPRGFKFGNDFMKRRVAFGKVLGDWRNTLEQRPENHSVETTEKAWRGPEDGLPPVGTECEISNCENLFTWCRVKYMGERLCVVDHKTHRDQHYHLSSVEFRPIRSEEDKVVDKMMKVMDAVAQAKMVVHEKQARALYQAGLRFKQENPE